MAWNESQFNAFSHLVFITCIIMCSCLYFYLTENKLNL